MPLAAIPAVIGASAIGAGGGIATSLIAKRSQKNAVKQMQNDPLAISQRQLIDQQKAQGEQLFGQAQNLLPRATEAIDIPYSHYKAILSGDPAEFNKVLGSSNQAIDRSVAGARSNITQFAPRGAIAGQLAKLATGAGQQKSGQYFDAYLKSLAGAGDSATQYGNLFNSLLSGGQGAQATALQGATAGRATSAATLLAQSQQNAEMLQSMGRGLGTIFSQLLMKPKEGSSRTSSTPVLTTPGWGGGGGGGIHEGGHGG